MKAKRTVAMPAAGCIAIVSVLASAFILGANASTVSGQGRARLAVVHSEKTSRPAGKSLEEQAQEVVRLRNQVEAVAVARRRMQDQAALKRSARNAAAARMYALGKTSAESRKERASRDAERNKYEGTPKEIARNLLADHGWDQDQWPCLEKLWNRESRWQVDADNPTSSAYGIPQALPGRRMAEYGADWRTNPVTQIKWGLDYIEDAHDSPCGAWAHSEAKGWY